MKLNEAKNILKESGWRIKYKPGDEIEINDLADIDETKCPNCDAEGDCYDSDMQDDFVYHYYECPECKTKWRVDNELKPKWIVIK